MINLCFLTGKVINEVDLEFIYNPATKSLNKKHTSIVVLEIETKECQVFKLYGYDKMADFIYRNIRKNDIIWIRGELKNNRIEIHEVIK